MKKPNLIKLLLLIIAPVLFFGCGQDDGPSTPPPPPINLNGFFVYGTSTVADDVEDEQARMALATLNPDKSGSETSKTGYFGKYMHIGANSTLSFARYKGTEGTIYGAAGGGTKEVASVVGNSDIADQMIHGTLEADGTPIAIAEEGLYYVFADTIAKTFRLIKLNPNIIGGATPNGWEASTSIPLKSSDLNTTVFEATDVAMKGADGYKIRFNQGYEIFNDGAIATINYLGVDDYATAWDAGAGNFDLIYKDVNIPNHEGGIYTITLTFDYKTGEWTEVKTKTGEIVIDYSAVKMAIIGNAFEGGSWNGDGTGGLNPHAPTKTDNVFKWTWNDVTLIQDMEFIFLEEATWGKTLIAYPGATAQGKAITDKLITNAKIDEGKPDENFYVKVGGNYNITLEFDGVTDAKTVTIEPVE